MMARKIIILTLIAGIVLGVAATEGLNVYRQSHDDRIFQERLRCKAAADAYVKEKSPDPKEDPFVTVDKVDYSPARNSCVAELETTYWGPPVLENLSVQDLLSGENLFSSGICSKDCADLRPLWGDPAFDYAMKNVAEPLELQMQYGRVQSMRAPKSAPQIDPATGERIQGPWSKYPPKSPPPPER